MCFILLIIKHYECQQVDPGTGMDHRDLGPFRDRVVTVSNYGILAKPLTQLLTKNGFH